MKLYKLTRRNGETQRSTKWGPGVTNSVSDIGLLLSPQLCTNTVIHAYLHPLQMLIHRGRHGFCGKALILWEAEGKVVAHDYTKVGVRSLTTVKKISMAFGAFTLDLERKATIMAKLQAVLVTGGLPGHPRTGSVPLKAIRAAVNRFLSTLELPTYDEGVALYRMVWRMKRGRQKDLAIELVRALRGYSEGPRLGNFTPAQLHECYERAWPYIQPLLEAARQQSLAARRERDRARRMAARVDNVQAAK